MRRAARFAWGASLLLFALAPRMQAATDLEEMVTVIHLHSSPSGGRGDPDSIGFAVSRPSVMGMGTDQYIEELGTVEREAADLLLVPGLEVAPYAHWVGSLLRGDLELRGWHRHLLLLGIEDTATLERLPVSGNRRGGVYDRWSFAYFIPAAILVLSVMGLTRACRDQRSGWIGPAPARRTSARSGGTLRTDGPIFVRAAEARS